MAVTGDATITGDITADDANFTTVTTTGDGTIGGDFSVAGDSALAGDLAVTGDSTLTGTLTVGGLTTLDATNGMQFGAAGQNVNAIDATAAGVTAKSATTLATVTTVLSSAQNADFTPTGTNAAAAATIKDGINTLDTAIGDRTLASSNVAINTAMSGTSVAAGLQAAGNAIGDMNFAGTKYVSGAGDLSDAVRTLDSNLSRVDGELKDLKKEFKNGMASLSAMSALVPNPRATGNTSLSIGTGFYDGNTAVAIGGFHHITDNIMVNAGAAWGNANDLTYRLGVTWSW